MTPAAAIHVAGLTLTLPIRTVSEANSHEHWRFRQRRAKAQRAHAGMAMFGLPQSQRIGLLPCTVKLTRISSGMLDSDNLPPSMKHVRDGIADAFGINDRDPRIEWKYDQERGKRGQFAVRVEIVAR